jgi:flagellar M-ring protein FliF
MDQIRQLIERITVRQRIIIGLAVVLVMGGVGLLVRWNSERDFQTLYSGLAVEDASSVVQKLTETGTEYRLTPDGTTVKVRSDKVADLRLQLAGAGLPKSGRIGYELFDKANLGASEFTEQINYHRALEGELERSMMTLAEMQQVRVHLTQPKESVFLEGRKPAKASVLLKLKIGARLSPQNIQAITHLVASAVEGLTPEMVSVLDSDGNLLNRPRRAVAEGEDAPNEATLEFRRRMEQHLLSKINATLEPLVGPEKYRAGVSVECDFTSGEQSEEIYDPARSVMTSSQRTEDLSGGAQGAAGGVPGIASNLGPAPGSATNKSGGVTRRTENIAYLSSRVVKRTKTPQGGVKRISVSILLDHNVRFEGPANNLRRIVEAPTPERIKATRDLIATAVGLQTERGDRITIESLPFESTLAVGRQGDGTQPAPPAAPPGLQFPAWLADAIQKKNFVVLGAIGAVLLGLLTGGAFLLARKLRKPNAQVTMNRALAKGEPDFAPKLEEKLGKQVAEVSAHRMRQEQEILNSLPMKRPSATTQKNEVLIKQLADEHKKDAAALPQIVKTWMSELDG